MQHVLPTLIIAAIVAVVVINLSGLGLVIYAYMTAEDDPYQHDGTPSDGEWLS